MMNVEDVTNWETQWRDVVINDAIKIVGMKRGRSAAKYKAISVNTNNSYIVFMKDLLEMLPALDGNCHIKGGFIVRKRGSNFGLGLANPYKVDDVNWDNRVSVIPEYI